jgi:uncharacterized protein
LDYPQYDPQSAVTPLSPEELDGLDLLLQKLQNDSTNDGVMTLDGMDGFLTALQVGPPQLLATLRTAEWLPWVWGGDVDGEGEGGSNDAVPFPSKRQKKATVVLLLRHLRHIGQQLTKTPDDWEPIFSVAEQGAEEYVDARDWCTGFLQAVDLLPSAWDAVFEDAELGPALAPLLLLGGGLREQALQSIEGQDLDNPRVCDPISRAVPDAVLRVLARRADVHPSQPV